MHAAARLLLLLGGPAALMLAGCSSSSTPEAANSVYTPPMATVTPITPTNNGSGTSTAPGAMRLSQQELKGVLSGQTATGVARNGQTYYAYFQPNGEVRFEEGAFRDTGSWWVSDNDQLCSRLPKLDNGATQCYSVYRNGTLLTYNLPDGQTQGSFTTLSGNPRQL